jgi:tRNA pseudouridine38-40 synthase
MEGRSLVLALNSLLPRDIGIYEAKIVSDDFNARFSVKKKTYIYRLWLSEGRDPFLYPFVWQINRNLDIEALREGAEIVSGGHDFSGFAKLEEERNTLIDLSVEVRVQEPLVELRFTATHFLRYMVRRVVGALVKRAEGKLRAGELASFLKGEHCPYTAPSKGLTLEKVYL